MKLGNIQFLNTFKSLCKTKGVGLSTACKEAGLDQSAYTRWEDSCPAYKTLEKLSIYFNVSINYLLGENENDGISPKNEGLTADEIEILIDFRKLSPVGKRFAIERVQHLVSLETANELAVRTTTIKHSVFKVSAGTGQSLLDNDWEEISIPDTPMSRRADYALTINGDSMQPDYNDGDIVLVREQPAVNVGEVGIYTLRDKGYIKKFGGDRLISLNKKYDDIILSDYDMDDIRCCGLVIGKI
jgi:SOS-response transcriptional repressor LexA